MAVVARGYGRGVDVNRAPARRSRVPSDVEVRHRSSTGWGRAVGLPLGGSLEDNGRSTGRHGPAGPP